MRLARVISTISLMISVSLAEDLQIGSKIPLADVKMKDICAKFQDESGATDMEVKTLLRELARVW